MITTLSLETPTHGRVLVRPGTSGGSLIVGFHGYGQSAEWMIETLERLPDAGRETIVAVQALHRFYSRGDRDVIASWMTRQDREQAIADNVTYVNRAVEAACGEDASRPIVFAGFSQGASMAYRAALLGRHRAMGVIALGGDIPADVKTIAASAWPPVLIGGGEADEWFTPARLDQDAAFLASHGVAHDVCRFHGGHEWSDAFGRAVRDWLDRRR